MEILSLFDGMSCGQQAISNLGIKDYTYFASEIDKFAIQVTKANFPKTIQIGNILDVSGYDFKEVDLLLGGSPCTNLSFAGKQKGLVTKENIKITKLEQYLELKEKGFEFEGQSYLFWEYMRILNEVKPKYFLLENVVMSKEWEKVFNEAIGFESVKINSALLTAQSRKRLYWVGKLQEDGTYSKVEIEQPEDRGMLLKDILEENVDEKYYLSDKNLQHYKRDFGSKGKILEDLEEKSPTLISAMGTGGGNIPCIVATQIGQSKNFGNSWGSEKGYTIKTNTGHGCIDLETMRIRKLTPTECERLQGVAIIEKNYIVDIDLLDNDYLGLDQVRNYVNAEKQNHKLQNVALNAEREEKKENAGFAERNLNIRNQQTKKLVEENVLINGEQKQIVKFNLSETKLFVNNVERKENYIHQIEMQDFVLLNVGINTILEKIPINGGVELHLKGKNYIQLQNGKIVLKGYGKEIMQLVKDVETDLTIHKKHLKYIIENLSNIKNIEQELITLFLYAISVIIGYTQDITLIKNILISQKRGFTASVSNSQRYKMLGNGWTIPIIEHILKTILFPK